MATPTWQDAVLRYRVPRDLATPARRAPFRVRLVGSALSVTPSSGRARLIHQSEFELSLPLLDHAGRSDLVEATFNSSYIEAIVDDLRRSVGEGAVMPIDAAWERYGRALHRAIAEVLEEFLEGHGRSPSRPPTTGSAWASRSASSARTRRDASWS